MRSGLMSKIKQIMKICICPKDCDCENPESKDGVALVSNLCPIHNDNPYPDSDCTAKVHHNGAR